MIWPFKIKDDAEVSDLRQKLDKAKENHAAASEGLLRAILEDIAKSKKL